VDVESPKHLEKLRDYPEIKAALLGFQVALPDRTAEFERSPKNTLYWPPIRALARRFTDSGSPAETRENIEVYGQPCWLISTLLDNRPDSPYAIAITDAAGAGAEDLIEALRRASDHYWNGSYFWK
jgi:hypothetical protein